MRVHGFLILLLICNSLSAISLDEAKKMAEENNKYFLSQKANLNQAKWNEYNAITNFLPKFSLNETAIRLDDNTYNKAIQTAQIPVFNSNGIPTGDYIPFSPSAMSGGMYRTTYTTQLAIQQPIFNGGKILIGYQIAKLVKEQALLNLESGKNDLNYQVAETYLNLLKLSDVKKISEKALASSKSHLKMVTDKYEQGIVKKSDVLQWKVKGENDKIALEEVNNSIEILKTLWKDLLGLKNSDNLPMPDEIDFIQYENEIEKYAEITEEEIDREIDKILTQAEITNPDIKSLEIVKKISKKGYLIAKGNFLPSINLQFQKQFESDDKLDFDGEDSWNLMAVASFPIFQSGANLTNLKRSKYEYLKTKLQLDDAKDKILMGTKNSFYNLVTKAKKVNSAKVAFKNAKENHKILNDLYEQGMVTNTELLDAEIILFNGEMNLTSAYYDYILAKYNLNKFIKE
ncbi:MAG: TolC family protein [Candidatus Cloacimonadota bacterium]|nr:TolC family protein [Candidatus Cloacimonadota bacterium]